MKRGSECRTVAGSGRMLPEAPSGHARAGRGLTVHRVLTSVINTRQVGRYYQLEEGSEYLGTKTEGIRRSKVILLSRIASFDLA